MFLILILIALVIVTIVVLTNSFKLREVLHIQKKNNVIVYGHKGKGKDLVFQWFINKRKKEPYYSNVDYGHEYREEKILNLNVDNDFNNFINDKINIAKKIAEREKIDTYISDGGVYLPSNYDNALHKRYMGFPIYYALSRHLYNSNVHVNVQNIDRLWKPLREQADYYIRCKGVVKLPFILFVKCVGYENYTDAVQNLEPLKTRFFDKNESKSSIDIANSSRGEIKKFVVPILKRSINYDTREFHKIIFGKSYEEWLDEEKEKNELN